MAESHGKIYLYERILYMSFGLLASFIVFAIIISFSIKKQARRKNINEADFWTKESQANSVRRKSLDGLRYIHIPLEAFPTHLLNDDPDVMDCINILENLTAQKIVNLTGWSNTELKLEYGTANITALSEYDQNYTLLVRTLQKWADALLEAAKFDRKILVEEFIDGREIEVAVMGNDSPVASICGEIDSGVEFYDYEAKYVTDTSTAYIPARISEQAQEAVREAAVRIYSAIGCQGLSRVDFFVTPQEEVVFNEINTLPGFTSISMYPKLFNASGIAYPELIDQLLALALEAAK